MKLRLIVVGKGATELAAYETRVLRRLRQFVPCDIQELPEARARQASQRLQEEARHIQKKADGGFILFDERGRFLSSHDWADWLGRQQGNASLDFVIGGADGVADEVRRTAADMWGLSRLTLPHQLARVMVLEQLYRAFTIRRGHPYHRA